MDPTDGLSPSSDQDGSLRNTTRNSVVHTGNGPFSFSATLRNFKSKSVPVVLLTDGPVLNK